MKTVRMAAMFLATLLVIYPLSIGPAAWLDFKLGAKARRIGQRSSMEASKTFTACYYPMYRLIEKCPDIDPAVGWYVRLWVPVSERD